LGGNTYKAIQAVTLPGPNPTSNIHYWQLNQVQSNTTLMIGIGQTFQTLNIAWTYALNARVADGVYLHFYISTAQGSYGETFNGPFLVDHSSGARMAILGDNPANISLNFFGTNGFIIDTGHSINTISGITLTNTSSASTVGLKADGNATVSALSNVVLSGFGTGVQSTQNSTVTILESTTIANFVAAAADAETDGSIYFPQGVQLTGVGALSSLVGLYAKYGGTIVAQGSMINDCAKGAYCLDGAMIDIHASTLTNCTVGAEAEEGAIVEFGSGSVNLCSFGCVADIRGLINCELATFMNDQSFDLSSLEGAYINATGATYATSQVNGAADGSYIQQ
jgi:hypothetical protein